MRTGAPVTRPLWLALALAVVSGPITDAAHPDQGIWPLVFVGVACVLVALRGRTFWSGALVGFVAGLSFYLVHISWASLYLGPVPWVALSTLESLFVAVGAGTIAVVYRYAGRAWPTALGRLGLVPVVVAGLWTAREAISAVWPYGGFSWGRIAFSQSESPFAPLVAWVGVSGLSFLLVWLVALAIELALWVPLPFGTFSGDARGEERYRAPLGGSARTLVAVGAVALVLVVPAWPTITEGSMRVAAVQGNSKAGYFDVRDPGDILTDNISATLPVVDDDLDVVVWPENGSDLDPLEVPQAAKALDYVSDAANAPLVVGTVTQRGDEIFNTSMLWRAGEGMLDFYDKKHPVPFGEYVPDRAFWEPFAPELIGLIQRDYTPGTTDPVFDIDGVIAGISICFDIVDDQLIHDMIDNGADVIFAQTNNADFGRTDENEQQLAITRLRAIETSRSVVNVSTVAATALLGPDGSTIGELPSFEAGALVGEVPLSTVVTPAMSLGRGIEWLVSGLGLAGLVLALTVRPRRPGQRKGPRLSPRP